jgi:hypothetical protein
MNRIVCYYSEWKAIHTFNSAKHVIKDYNRHSTFQFNLFIIPYTVVYSLSKWVYIKFNYGVPMNDIKPIDNPEI